MVRPLPTQDALRAVDPLNAEWVTLVLLGTLLLTAVIHAGSPRKVRLFARSMFTMRLGKQALREELDLQDRAFLGLLLIGTVLLALFGWQALLVRGGHPSFLVLFGAVLGLVLAQYLLVRMVGALLQFRNGVEEYAYTGLLLFILAGIVLLPLVVFIAYRPGWRAWAVVAGALLLAALVLFRWLRGVWIGLGEGVPARYIILYFCGAELIPVLLVIDRWRTTLSTLFHS